MFQNLLLFLLLLQASFLVGQNRNDLENQRNSLTKDIANANRQLIRTRSAQTEAVNEVAKLQQLIGTKAERIAILSTSIDTISNSIDRKISVIEKLDKDLIVLKENYKKIIRQLYRFRLQKDALSFILAAQSFNDAYLRFIYLQKLVAARSELAKAIKSTQLDLTHYIDILESNKTAHSQLLNEELTTQDALEKKKLSKSQKANELQKQEKRLREDLNRKKRYKNQLNQKIEGIIKQQIAEAKRAARARQSQPKVATTTPAPKKSSPNTTPPPSSNNDKAASHAFAQQKGKLTWPIYQGTVIVPFGKRQHPSLKDVQTYNNGIDIKGEYNSIVRNVFDGEVVSIFSIPGMGNALMVRHGDYFTTYSNVAKIYVKKGQFVRTGMQLGSIARDPSGNGHSMHFELWHGKVKENPSNWLKK